METAEIRRRWLTFFESRGHTVVPSAPLVHDDPNLLFVNAGMVPFKPYFLGQETPAFTRATSVQKCVRTLDIEEVGKTTRHGTFFQMNGNFSFGDYFKEGAISLAWELVTRSQSEGGYGFDEKDLYASVYHEDDEAIAIWKKVAGLPDDRIVRLGKKDNYWNMGVPGPGGPCSEILIDRGPEFGADRDWDAGDRYLEFWNLVFMQDDLSAVRSKEDFDIAGGLPKKNIDTGMGLERVAYLLQGVDNIYEIDEIFPVISVAEDLSGRRYGANLEDDVRFRVVADHVRSALMLIGDGVTPGNEGRGYVLRRLIRRAVRSMRLLGVDAPTLEQLLPVSKDRMKASYPELETGFGRISQIAYAEEDAFRRTLSAGTTILDTAVARAKSSGPPVPRWGRGLRPARHVRLPDRPHPRDGGRAGTAGRRGGLPPAHGGAARPREGRRQGEEERPRRHAGLPPGGRRGRRPGRVHRLRPDGHGRDRAWDHPRRRGRRARRCRRGDRDRPRPHPALCRVRRPAGGPRLHPPLQRRAPRGERRAAAHHRARRAPRARARGRGGDGGGRRGRGRRRAPALDLARPHCDPHGAPGPARRARETATQAGSENSPGRLRFDFKAPRPCRPRRWPRSRPGSTGSCSTTCPSPRTSWRSTPRAGWARWRSSARSTASACASSRSATGRASCASARTRPRVGQIGVVKLLGEASIGSGVRRVEALVGADAYGHLAREAAIVSQLTETLNVRRDELPDRIAGLLAKLKDAEREIAAVKQGQVLGAAPGLVASARDLGGVTFVSHDAGSDVRAEDLRALVLDVRSRLGGDRPVVVSMAAVAGGRPFVIVATNERARGEGIKAGAYVRVAAQVLGGGGGGKDDIAQGGGSDPSRSRRARRGRERASHPGRMSPDGERPTHVARHGARVGVDVGNARVGVAASDPSGSSRTQCAPWGVTPRPTPTCTRSSPSPRRSEPSRSSSACHGTSRARRARPPGLPAPMPSGWPS